MVRARLGYITRDPPARQPAQGLTEYGLIITLVAFVAIVGLATFGAGLGLDIASLLSSLGSSV